MKNEINPKIFTKVKAKKNLYKTNNPVINSISNKEIIKDNEQNQFIKKSKVEQPNLDFINKSDFIKEAIAYSKLRKLKKNLSSKNNTNTNKEVYNTFFQGNDNKQFNGIGMDYEIEKGNNYKKIIFDLKNVNTNDNNKFNFQPINNNYKPNTSKSQKENLFIEYNNNRNFNDYNKDNFSKRYNLSRSNKNILIMEEDDKNFGITERKNYSIERFFKKNKKNMISGLLLLSKKKDKNPQNTSNNSFLNVSVNQIRECPLFEKIKMPEKGHSRGIIEMIKNYKETSVNKPTIGQGKIKKLYNKENNNKKEIHCLNDQKVFDEPKKKPNINNKNFSYKKKILNNRSGSTNKNKIFPRNGINRQNREIIINYDKNLSFNNNFEVRMPMLTKKNDLGKNYINKKKDLYNTLFFKKDNFLYQKYASNKNIKNNTFYKNIKNNNAFNIQSNSTSNNYDRNNSDFKMLNDFTNIKKNNNVNLTRSESESEKNNKNNLNKYNLYASPMINNRIKLLNYQHLNDYLEEDFIFYQTLPRLTKSIKRRKSNSINRERFDEIKLVKNIDNKQGGKNGNIINQNSSYFYNKDNLTFYKDNKILPNENNDKKLDSEFYPEYNNSEIKNAILNVNLESHKKLMKTKSSNNFNKNNLLYLKPKNKLKKNLKNLKLFYSSNLNKNDNNNQKDGSILGSPKIKYSEMKSPNSINNLEFCLLNNNEEKEEVNHETNNFKDNPKLQIYLNENEALFNSQLGKISNKKVYKKPINKSIINNSKLSPKYIEMNTDSNCLTHNDEIIYDDKTYNPPKNKTKLYNSNYNNIIIKDFNEETNSFKDEFSNLKIINKNRKNGFIKKYYNHCIQIPIPKNYYLSKINISLFKNKKDINIQVKTPNIKRCYLTKISIIKNKQEKEKEIKNDINISNVGEIELLEKNKDNDNKKINNENKNKGENKNKNKINKTKKKKKSKKKKEKKNENILENNKKPENVNSEIKENSSNENEENIEKFNLKFEKDNIKYDIIFLLNILTSKNILSIENQLTKLIITSCYIFKIQNNEDQTKLFLNDIIKNENTFIEILMNKVISENKFNEIYSKLCYDLCNKYLNSINEIIIMKFMNKNENNQDDFNIIKNLKIKINEKCLSKFEDLIIVEINNDNKSKIFNLINFICLSLDYKITEIETCLSIINILFNQYEKNINETKYYYLDIIIYLILKIQIIDFEDKNSILEKISYIINNDNLNNIPNLLKNRINKFKTIFDIKEIINKEENNSQSQEYIFEGNSLLIKEDMEKYYDFLKTKEIDLNSKIKENIEIQYDWHILKTLKKIDLYEIINDYITICKYTLKTKDQISCYKSYIKNIIETMSYKLSLNKMRAFHNKILEMISNISNICREDEYMYEIFGNLLYILIINEFCDIEDINIFISKDSERKISICKTSKYIILSSENIKEYYDKFKNLNLFKNNELFDKYITSDLKDILNILFNEI